MTRPNLDARRTMSALYDNIIIIPCCLSARVGACPRALAALSQVDGPGGKTRLPSLTGAGGRMRAAARPEGAVAIAVWPVGGRP